MRMEWMSNGIIGHVDSITVELDIGVCVFPRWDVWTGWLGEIANKKETNKAYGESKKGFCYIAACVVWNYKIKKEWIQL